MKIVITKRAQTELDRIERWWQANRDKAPERFEDELEKAKEQLQDHEWEGGSSAGILGLAGRDHAAAKADHRHSPARSRVIASGRGDDRRSRCDP